MSNGNTTTPGALHWGISGIALVWNLMGLTAYWATVTISENDLMQIPEAERALYENLPVWVTSAFAIAVVAGLLGSLALVMRRKWATPLLILSLLAVVAQRIHTFFMTDFFSVVTPDRMVLPLLVIVVAVFLVGYARYADGRGWLN